MKKLMTALCLVLVFSMLLSPVASAAGGNTDTLADWDLRITVPDGKTAVLKGNEYYIYGMKDGSIPYVMVRMYDCDSETVFLNDFTRYMQKQYADLEVTFGVAEKTVGGRSCHEVDYTYKVQGYDVTDRRVAVTVGNRTYMFASKEVESLGLTLGGMLDEVVAGCEFLSAPPAEETPSEEPPAGELPGGEMADGYLYCLGNGMPKYWLDLSGAVDSNLVLHCWFRSSDPTFYESVFILDLFTADIGEDEISINTVWDTHGFDHSDKFEKLVLREDGKRMVLEVERDESTLAGGPEDNILTGVYPMDPVGVNVKYEFRNDVDTLLYWLDPGEDAIDLHVLHPYSRVPREEVFTIDPLTATIDFRGGLRVGRLFDENGNDISDRFLYIRLVRTDDGLLMDVDRIKDAPGQDIDSGSWLFKPVLRLMPAGEGPFTPAELCSWAQIYYFQQTGFFPPEADFEKNDDGSYTIHLYEIVETSDFPHTATCAWYTVDEYGVGYDDIFGDEISLAG